MEEFIKYETAKICKEKGIDLPHTHYYIYPFRSFKADGELKKNTVPDDYNDNMRQVVKSRKMQPQIAPAYTQAQLQKYLREYYNIHLTLGSIGKNKYTLMIDEVTLDGTLGKNIQWTTYNTYEDALEIGLQSVLEMIEIGG